MDFTPDPDDLGPVLSVVVPLYNERDNLAALRDQLVPALDATRWAYEVLLVDDGSTDGSGPLCDQIAAETPGFRALHLETNSGQTAALDAGFRSARGTLVATLDADLQNDPADLLRLLPHLDRADAVCGVRVRRTDGFVRGAASKIANWVRNRLTGDSIQDTGCTLRVCRAEFLRRIVLHRGMHRFLPTLLRMEGARVVEIPVSHRPRQRGFSKYGIWDRALPGLRDCLAVRWMKDRKLHYRLTNPGSPSDGTPSRPPRPKRTEELELSRFQAAKDPSPKGR